MRYPVTAFFRVAQFIRKKTLIDHFFPTGYAFVPAEIFLLPTLRCSHNCPVCGIVDRTGKSKLESEMSYKEIKKLLEEISWFKPRIFLYGGEPFLRKEAFDICDDAKHLGLMVQTVTNGTELNVHNINRLFESGISSLAISLDGDEESHNYSRGVKNAYSKAINAIALINEKKMFSSSHVPEFGILFTLNPYNANEVRLERNIKFMFSILDKYPTIDYINFGHLIFSIENGKQSYKNLPLISQNKKTILMMRKQAKKAIEYINKFAYAYNCRGKIRFFPSLQGNDELNFWYSESPPKAGKNNCFSPWDSAFILPNGDVSFCQGQFVIGNLRKQSFFEIWNGKKAKFFRKEIKKDISKKCFRCCIMPKKVFRLGVE